MIRASLCLDSIVTQYKGAGSSGPLFVRLNTAAQEDHRQKIRTDPLYAQVVRDSRRQWQAEHADCQNVYWQAHLEAAERNRERQRDRQRRIGTARSYAMPAAGGGDGLFQKELLAQRAAADHSPAQAGIDCAAESSNRASPNHRLLQCMLGATRHLCNKPKVGHLEYDRPVRSYSKCNNLTGVIGVHRRLSAANKLFP